MISEITGFHDCLGKCDGCVLIVQGLYHDVGLQPAIDALETVYQTLTTSQGIQISRADLWAIAGRVLLANL